MRQWYQQLEQVLPYQNLTISTKDQGTIKYRTVTNPEDPTSERKVEKYWSLGGKLTYQSPWG